MADQVVLLQQGPHRADGDAARAVCAAGDDLRRALHRHAGDEPAAPGRRPHRRQRVSASAAHAHWLGMRPESVALGGRGAGHRAQHRVPGRRPGAALRRRQRNAHRARRRPDRHRRRRDVLLGWPTQAEHHFDSQGSASPDPTIQQHEETSPCNARPSTDLIAAGAAAALGWRHGPGADHRDLVLLPGGRRRPDHQDHRRLRRRLHEGEPRHQGHADLRRHLPGHHRQGADRATSRARRR